MLSIPGRMARLCDGYSRREFLRVGGSTLFGLSLPQFFSLQARASDATPFAGSKGFGAAKSVIMLFLQGGPSHIDIWDPETRRAFQHARRVQADQDQSLGSR